MRWFVEISGLGKKPGKTATLCVEATQWQPALQRARSIRGDTGSLSAFSIELLDDGYRAIDPSARLKYVVKRAPDDAALSAGGAVSDAAPESKRDAKNGARSKSSPPPKTADGEKKASASFVPSTKPSEPVEAPAKPAPRAEVSTAGESRAVVIEAKPLIAIPLDRPPPPPAAPGLPSYNVQSERSEDPTSRSPLYYREVVYVVGDSTAASEVERLVRDRFADVRRSLASARSGKLVRLAVFDHVFSGKPKRPPVVTLTWKDWAGDEPEVRRAGHEAPAPLVSTPRPAPHKVEQATTTLASASKPAEVAKVVDAPPTAAPKTVETPKAEPAPAKVEAVVEVVDVVEVVAGKAAAAPEPAPAPERVASSEPPSAVSAKSSSPAISVREPSPSTVNRIIEIAEPTSAVEEVRISDAPAPSALPGPKTIVDAPRIDVMVDDDYVPPTPASFPTPSIVPPTPSYVPPAPSQPAATQPPPPPVPTVKRKKQLSADDLISELFEAMSELHFLGDALAGADYVLGVALEKIPCELGFVSLFDINKREFVVVRQRGGPRSVLGFRQPEKAPVALSAMRTKAAVIVDEAGSARAMDERYRAAGIEVRGLLCAPIALGGRYLGVIELANSEDGAFRVADANALTYVGQQLGEFVAERGVIIDAAHILESAKTAADAQAAQSKAAQSKRK